MNKKGFTMVELLAAITILGILTVMAFAGYSSYANYARDKAYVIMANSVVTAAEEYVMENPGASGSVNKTNVTEGKEIRPILSGTGYAPKIEIKDLLQEEYLSGAADPADKNRNCKGAVRIGLYEGKGKNALDQYVYYVDLCCSVHKKRYLFSYLEKSDGTVVERQTIAELGASTCNGYSY